MSRRYEEASKVPTGTLVNRLKELSNAVTKGREGVAREFDMRIPAEVDRDADIILAEAAIRLENNAANLALKELVELKELKDNHGKTVEYCRRKFLAWERARKVVKETI